MCVYCVAVSPVPLSIACCMCASIELCMSPSALCMKLFRDSPATGDESSLVCANRKLYRPRISLFRNSPRASSDTLINI